MSRMISCLLLFVLTLSFVSAQPASACPLCKEAITAPGQNGAEDDDSSFRSAQAYNSNILAMIGTMYGSLFFVGFLIYRGVKKNAIYQQMQRSSQPS